MSTNPYDTTSTNPYDSPEARPPGMSGASKVLLGLGIGCGLFVLICCGGGGLSSYFYFKSVGDSISKDPGKVREVTSEIVTIEIPESLPPVMCMSVPIPFVNRSFMTWAIYGDDEEKNMLAIMEFGWELDEQQMDLQWRNSMRNSGRRDIEDVDVVKSESHDIDINGHPASFRIVSGQAHKSKRDVWQVMGTFHGKKGSAMLFLQVNQADLTKEDLIHMLDSMKDPDGVKEPDGIIVTEPGKAAEPNNATEATPPTDAKEPDAATEPEGVKEPEAAKQEL